MYSKATYVKPYIRKFIRVLGINNVGTLNKPKMNVIYAILANNGIKPIDKNQYGVPLYQYRDLDGLNDLSIIAGFHKWKDDMLRKDIEISMRDTDKVKKVSGYKVTKKQPDTQTQIQFDDENDDRLYESLFSKKAFFTEQQVKTIQESEQPETKKAFFTEEQINYIKDKLDENSNFVNPNKVLLIKKYLDDNFVRASMPIIGDDGYPKNVHIVGMKGADGEVARNMTAKQLFYLLQDKFKGIYGDKAKRNALIKQTMIDWYNKKISNEGLLSKNMY